ncbi:MAG: glutathione-disulfide reductase [Methylococcaceae bacterium]
MSIYDYDLIVIGAGSGGVRAARMAAQRGANVAIVENRYLGGTCVNVGCVPKKLLVYASQFNEEFHAARGFGWSLGKPSFNWSQFLSQKNQEIERLQGVYQRLLEDSEATIIDGKGRILDPHTVSVNDQSYRAKHILIATGGWPSVPDILGNQYAVTSNEMFFLEQLPERIIIVGGGYIAVEFASIMNGLGVSTTVCHRGDKLLRGFDEDLRDFLAHEMTQKGIQLIFNSTVQSIEQNSPHITANISDGRKIDTDLLLFATGRAPNTSGLGLESVNVDIDENGAIQVNADYQTNVPSIYALGDVTNRVNLTPVATAEAMALVDHLFGNQKGSVSYDTIPTAVFSQPNIATVGLTESEARKHYQDIDVYLSTFKPLKHSISGLDEKTLIKLIVARSAYSGDHEHRFWPS